MPTGIEEAVLAVAAKEVVVAGGAAIAAGAGEAAAIGASEAIAVGTGEAAATAGAIEAATIGAGEATATGIGEAANLGITEGIKETAFEVTGSGSLDSSVLNLSKHELTINDVNGVVENLKSKEITSLTKASEDLGDQLARTELERKGNIILERQPQYSRNPETGYPFRADYRFRTNPGSSFFEAERVGNKYILNEKINSVSKEYLLDVKNHSVSSLRGNLADTIEKIKRMKEYSPNAETTISLPSDVITDPSATELINQIRREGATVIAHAPYRDTMRMALKHYFNIKR